MPTLSNILDRKGKKVVTIEPTATVLDAASEMNQRGIGGLVVMDGLSIVGIFTERDILRRVVAAKKDPAKTPVDRVMTGTVETCSPETSIDACRALMTERRIRHIPVVAGAKLVGIVTSGDVLAYQVEEQQSTIEHLTDYVQGRM